MMRYLCGFLLALASFCAFAQSKVAEAPTEQASPVVVVIFLIMFVVGCVGTLGYMWWNGKKKEKS